MAGGAGVDVGCLMEFLNDAAVTRGKTAVLTNAYPPGPHPEPLPLPKQERLTLIHAGRLAGSRNTQTLGALVLPLMASLDGPWKADVQMVGSLNTDDLAEMERARPAFEAPAGRRTTRRSLMPRCMRAVMADGLLLLCASRAPIPSKLFDYIPTRGPFRVTPATSALALADTSRRPSADPSAGTAMPRLRPGSLRCAMRLPPGQPFRNASRTRRCRAYSRRRWMQRGRNENRAHGANTPCVMTPQIGPRPRAITFDRTLRTLRIRAVLLFLIAANVFDMGGVVGVKYVSYACALLFALPELFHVRAPRGELLAVWLLFAVWPTYALARGIYAGADIGLAVSQSTALGRAPVYFLLSGTGAWALSAVRDAACAGCLLHGVHAAA